MGCPRNIELCGPFRHELYEDRRDVYIIRDNYYRDTHLTSNLLPKPCL